MTRDQISLAYSLCGDPSLTVMQIMAATALAESEVPAIDEMRASGLLEKDVLEEMENL
jgi:hypothetical protein